MQKGERGNLNITNHIGIHIQQYLKVIIMKVILQHLSQTFSGLFIFKFNCIHNTAPALENTLDL